jgi:TonB family protein
MRRALAAALLALAAAASAFGQTNADEARRELNEGTRAYRYGKFEEAESHFRRALELDPEGKNTRVFIARAAQQQYKPGVQTPENIALGERAVAAYQEVLARDPANEDAYKAVVFLYGQMNQEDKVRELLLSRANDFSLPNEKRAEAFTILASKQWQCSYDVTEQKENKVTENKPDKAVTRYKMPADSGDFIRARECVNAGLQMAEQAVSLAPKNPNALSYKANLLREAAKLAEMEGDAGGADAYERQYAEALDAQKRLADETYRVAGTQVAPAPEQVPPPPPATPEPGAERRIQGGVLNGKAISKPQPAYPPAAKAARASGTVTVRVLVDEEGRVIEAEAVSGHPLLQQAAVTAARQARFSPTLLSGQPVKVAGVVTYNFVLQ